MIHKFSYFLCFEENFEKNYAAFAAYAAYLYSSYRSNCKLSLRLILQDVYMYLFHKQYAVFVLPRYFLEVLRRWKKVFWVSHFAPDYGANETVPPASNKQFLQYKRNGIQLLMYMLFIQIVWFTFQYNFMHYSQFFQELYWVLALSVSLCPALR